MADHGSGPVDTTQFGDALRMPPPWWERFARIVVERWGFPTAAALGLSYVLYVLLTANIAAWSKQQDEIKAILVQHVNDVKKDQQETRFYLRQICINSSKDEFQRAGCIAPESAR